MLHKEGKMVEVDTIIKKAKLYLIKQVENGLCQEFHQLRHGPSMAWTTACIGSALAEFNTVPDGILHALLKLRWDCGGWSYNQHSLPDADSTLRVLQFFNKLGFRDSNIIDKAEKFIISHQQDDGGFATYLSNSVEKMNYPEGGWTESHPCVTALAINVLQNQSAKDKAVTFLSSRLQENDARSYWWSTPWYVRYEAGWINGEDVGLDPIEISLALLLKTRLGMFDRNLYEKLANLQFEDGSFPASHVFRIPRPYQHLDDIDDTVEVVEDRRKIFSTAAAAVALSRQTASCN